MDWEKYENVIFDFESEIDKNYNYSKVVSYKEAISKTKILKYPPSYFVKKFLEQTKGSEKIENCHYKNDGSFWINYDNESAVGTSGYIYNFQRGKFFYACTEMCTVYNRKKQGIYAY